MLELENKQKESAVICNPDLELGETNVPFSTEFEGDFFGLVTTSLADAVGRHFRVCL
jgi:hypothetical protein